MELLLHEVVNNILVNIIIFTFQYGATSTIKGEDDFVCGYQFTFQYGATSTGKVLYNFHSYFCNLHSNMELLLLKATKGYENQYYEFTFQYGATSTLYSFNLSAT